MNARALSVIGLISLIGFTLVVITARAAEPAPVAGGFTEIAAVLQSPRCANCHPADDTPKVGDRGQPHPQEITRAIDKIGMTCGSCHLTKANAASRLAGAPPAVPGWALPPKDHPMPFFGLTARALCEQLKDPGHNGGKDGAALVTHVGKDPLVLYGWDPGGKRTVPPIPHALFVERFASWVGAGMPCPTN